MGRVTPANKKLKLKVLLPNMTFFRTKFQDKIGRPFAPSNSGPEEGEDDQ